MDGQGEGEREGERRDLEEEEKLMFVGGRKAGVQRQSRRCQSALSSAPLS